MEKNSKKGLLVLVVILSLLVVGLSSYLIYDKVLADDNTTNNNENDVVDNNLDKEEESKENSEILGDNSWCSMYPSENKLDFSNLEIVDNIEKYKNYDDTYGSVEQIYFDYCSNDYGPKQGNNSTSYTISLNLVGFVEIRNDDTKEKTKLNVSDVVDIETKIGGQYDGINSLFMLTKNGEVYYYNLNNLSENNYEIEKINISNIVKFSTVGYGPQYGAGGCLSFVAVTEDEKYIELYGFCV